MTTKPTTVIFQDVDGPLIPGRMYFNGGKYIRPRIHYFKYDPVAVAMLNHLTQKFKAAIVFNSAHNSSGADQMRINARYNGLKRLHDDTITLFPSRVSRHTGIINWLAGHPEVKRWIVIDDELVHEPRQVLIDFDEGITMKKYWEAEKKLGADPKTLIMIAPRINT